MSPSILVIHAGVLTYLLRFQYNPDSLRVVLFPTISGKPRARSRTPGNNVDMDMDIEEVIPRSSGALCTVERIVG